MFSVSKITRGNKTYEVNCKTYEVGRKTYEPGCTKNYEAGLKKHEVGCRAEEVSCRTEEVGISTIMRLVICMCQKFYGVGSKQTSTVGHVALAP